MALLPPSAFPEKSTVVLDLDRTIVFSRQLDPPPPPDKYDFVVKVSKMEITYTFYVSKRPGVEKLLEVISKEFEIVVFTAAEEAYASQVLDQIDPKGLISHRLYRDSCKVIGGKLFKDLSALGREMGRVVIFDDQPQLYLFQSRPPRNVIEVLGFVGDRGDQELEMVLRFLAFMGPLKDSRVAGRGYKRWRSESASDGKSQPPRNKIHLPQEEKPDSDH